MKLNQIALFGVLLAAMHFAQIASAQTESTPTPPANINISRYRVIISGLPEFDCVSVENLGVQILRYHKDKPGETTFDPKILDLTLERRFTMDREFHGWIERSRKGKVEPRDGTLILQDETGNSIVQFNFVRARPKRWKMNIPRMDETNKAVTETIVLAVQDMQMVY